MAEQKLIYIEFSGTIDEISSYMMMNLLNADPNTKLIHTSFMDSKNTRLFVLEKTKESWIKVVGKTSIIGDAVEESDNFYVARQWVIGNIPTTFTFENIRNREDLLVQLQKNNQFLTALNLSYVKLTDMDSGPNRKYIIRCNSIILNLYKWIRIIIWL
jgi:hypothetical protein